VRAVGRVPDRPTDSATAHRTSPAEPEVAGDSGDAGDSRGGSSVTTPGRPGRLSRGNKAALILFFALLVVAVVGSLVKLPYAVMSPGPTVNTLGESPGTTKPIITVAGAPTYPTTGALKFTTVRVKGGPGYPVDVWDVLQAWVDPTEDVYPVDDLFDPQVSKEQVAEENAVQMEGSQEEATAVAFRALGKPVPASIAVAAFAPTSKAKGALQVKDRFVSVGGTQITTTESVRSALQQVKPGTDVPIVVERSGKKVPVDVPTIAGTNGRTALGVVLGLTHVFPATVTVDAGAVGGPSAGLMFSLGIYDKLTPGGLTANHDVAGTGTIDDAGQVGPIGGIKQKMAGARAGGAEYFLAPADNCNEVVGHVPDGLTVFKVATFDDGLKAVKAIAAGSTSDLPHC
jgi:PDZ domain-containing protein